jgi:hypothetical protein
MNRVVLNMDKDGIITVFSDEPVELYCVADHCPDDRVYQITKLLHIGKDGVDAQLRDDPVGHYHDGTTHIPLADADLCLPGNPTSGDVVCDVWGGDLSQSHLARYVLPVDQSIEWARRELASGYFVNLRRDPDAGASQQFDLRTRGLQ